MLRDAPRGPCALGLQPSSVTAALFSPQLGPGALPEQRPQTGLRVPNCGPGRTYDADEQCRFQHGVNRVSVNAR